MNGHWSSHHIFIWSVDVYSIPFFVIWKEGKNGCFLLYRTDSTFFDSEIVSLNVLLPTYYLPTFFPNDQKKSDEIAKAREERQGRNYNCTNIKPKPKPLCPPPPPRNLRTYVCDAIQEKLRLRLLYYFTILRYPVTELPLLFLFIYLYLFARALCIGRHEYSVDMLSPTHEKGV